MFASGPVIKRSRAIFISFSFKDYRSAANQVHFGKLF